VTEPPDGFSGNKRIATCFGVYPANFGKAHHSVIAFASSACALTKSEAALAKENAAQTKSVVSLAKSGSALV
jgi:hypothetical protein